MRSRPKGSASKRHHSPRSRSWSKCCPPRRGPLWYLLAWDLDRDDWRVFRVDRIVPHTPTGPRFQPRAIPEDHVIEHVVGRVSKAAWKYHARVLVHAPAAKIAAKIPIPVDIEVVDESTCHIELGSSDPDRLALWMTQLDVDIEVIDGDELAVAFDRLATRFRRAAGGASAAP